MTIRTSQAGREGGREGDGVLNLEKLAEWKLFPPRLLLREFRPTPVKLFSITSHLRLQVVLFKCHKNILKN